MNVDVESHVIYSEKELNDLIIDVVNACLDDYFHIKIEYSQALAIGKYVFKHIIDANNYNGIRVHSKYGIDENVLNSTIYMSMSRALNHLLDNHERYNEWTQGSLEKLNECIDTLKDGGEHIIIQDTDNSYIAIRSAQIPYAYISHQFTSVRE